MQIFLSYASEYFQEADRLALSLRQDAHTVFFDRSSLPKGESYDNRIREELSQSDFFIFLISPESVEKGSYALSELELCQKRFLNPSGHVLPVMAAATDWSLIPNYLQAVTILEPVGNLVAEVTAKVSEVADAKRKKKKTWIVLGLLITILIALVIFFSPKLTNEQSPVPMKALRGFSVFAEPNQDSRIIDRAGPDAEFMFLPEKRRDNWAHIRLDNGKEGWVMGQDMSFVESTVKKIDVARGFGFRGSFWQLFFSSPQAGSG